MTYPDPTTGQRLTDGFIDSMLDNLLIKPSNETKASVITPANDNDLAITVAANSVYYIEFVIMFACLRAANMKTAWSVPAGATGNRLCLGPGSANVASASANLTEMATSVNAYTTECLYSDPRDSVTSFVSLWERTVMTTVSSGTVRFQWAQIASNATGNVVAGSQSYARWRRIG